MLVAQATFNTLVSAALHREIKFKTTEKSIMAADVTDAANKAVKKSRKQRSPLAVLWMSIQARIILGMQYINSLMLPGLHCHNTGKRMCLTQQAGSTRRHR